MKNNNDVVAVKYIVYFLVFLLTLTSVFFIYYYINQLFAMVVGGSLIITLVFFIAQKQTFEIMETTLRIVSEKEQANAKVEEMRQKAQVEHLKAFQNLVNSQQKEKLSLPETHYNFKVNYPAMLPSVHEDSAEYRIVSTE